MSSVKWDAAAAAWLASNEGRKRSLSDDRDKITWLSAHLGWMELGAITSTVVHAVLTARRRERSPATVNRYWAAISGVLNHARALGWAGTLPLWKKLPEDNERVRWLTPDEWSRLYAELPAYPCGRLAAYALATGVRQANVTHLRREWINLQGGMVRYPASAMKNKRPFNCILSPTAIAIIEQQIREFPGCEWLFPYRGEPIAQPAGRAWKAACSRAGISDFHPHDIRHTWATWHVMNGTPLHVLKELGGWRTMAMVSRYAHLADDYLRSHAANAAGYCERRAA